MSNKQVLEIMAKQRQKYKNIADQKLKIQTNALESQRAEIAAIQEEKRRRQAWADLKRAFGSGDDRIASESAAMVEMDLLASIWEDGSTALHSAAAQGLLKCCETIVLRKDFQPAILCVQDQRGWTPLHCAVTSAGGGAEICELIANHKACRVGLKDNDGRTAADLAQEWGLASAKSAISEATAGRFAAAIAKATEREELKVADAVQADAHMMEHKEDAGSTVGFKLFKQGRYEDCIEVIKSAWPFINEIDDDKNRCRTLLHYAAHKGRADVCEAILDREDWESTDRRDLDRATALHLAAANRHVDCCIAIVASGRLLGVNFQDMRDQTALHLAAVRGDGECYNAILAHEGVDLSIRDYKNKLASEHAMERGLEVEPPVIDQIDDRDLEVDDPDLQVDL